METPHRPFVSARVPSLQSPFVDARLRAPLVGPFGSQRRKHLREPVRRCAGSPPTSVCLCPPHSAHTVTRPAHWAAPPRARVESYTLPRTNLSGGVRGGALRVHEVGKPAPVAALPTPPRRQQQVRVHHCQACAQPPRRFPAPRDYRSCRGSVAGSGRQPRPEGGAGRAAVPAGLRSLAAPSAPSWAGFGEAAKGLTELPWQP